MLDSSKSKDLSFQEIISKIMEVESQDGGNIKTRMICLKILQVLKVMKLFYTTSMEEKKILEIKLIQMEILRKINSIQSRIYKQSHLNVMLKQDMMLE